jgi:hypothetical protein
VEKEIGRHLGECLPIYFLFRRCVVLMPEKGNGGEWGKVLSLDDKDILPSDRSSGYYVNA